jgi:outer membrane receptor for ferric coprogen and ferric-rhodotorulic acid
MICVEGYWLVDATARYQIDEHLSATLAINNLLDKKHYTIFDSNYSWGEPRSAMLTLDYTF